MWTEEPFTRGQAWVDLLLLANHRSTYIRKRGIKVLLNRGDVGHSQVSLSDRWKWSRGKVKRFLNELENDQMIVQQNNNVTVCISIVNYDKYQNDDTTDDTPNEHQTSSKRAANGTGTRMIKNDKNVKNDKKGDTRAKFSPPELFEVIQYFIQNGYTESSARKAFRYYETGNWKDSAGKQVRNWKQKMQAVWFKPEHQETGQTMEGII